MRKLGASRQRLRIDREAMILRGDLHPPRAQIHHRMIRAVMAEAELVGVAAEREPRI